MKISRIPYKEIGNGLLSSGVFLSSYLLGGYTLGISVLVGGACYVGYRLLFGTDLEAADLWKGLDSASAQHAVEQITKARLHIAEIKALNEAIPSESLSEKLQTLEVIGDKIIMLFEEDPKNIRRSKRFVDVYLGGAVSVSRKFVELHQRTDNAKLHAQYESFLSDTVRTFDKQYRALLDDDMVDIDVEIEVLKKRMRSEAYFD